MSVEAFPVPWREPGVGDRACLQRGTAVEHLRFYRLTSANPNCQMQEESSDAYRQGEVV